MHGSQYQTWPVFYDVRPVYQTKNSLNLCRLSWLIILKPFSSFSHGDLDLNPNSPNIKLDLYLMVLHLCAKNVKICKAFHDLSSRKCFSTFDHADLDLNPTSPNIKLELYIIIIHLCTIKCLNLWSLSWVIVCKQFFGFGHSNLDLDPTSPNIKLDLYFNMLHQKMFSICKALNELSSGNRFLIILVMTLT